MKKLGLPVLFAAFFAVAILGFAQAKPKVAAQAQESKEHKHAPLKVSPEFARLKTLVGRWEGTSAEGPVTSTFRMTADGSAIMHVLAPDTEQEMLTVFHPDGPNIMGTHYCAAHNQPRFVAEPGPDPKVLTFKFKDVTNLASPGAEHIDGLVIRFIDDNHHIEEWSSTANGKVSTLKMEFARKN